MALTACRECGEQVSSEAFTCPHCGVRHPAVTEPAAAVTAASAGGRPSVFGGWLMRHPILAAVAAIFVIGLIGSALTGGHKDSPRTGTTGVAAPSPAEQVDADGNVNSDVAFGAQVVCEDFVKARLKAPGTAHFSGRSRRHNADDTYTSAGNVDSENSFGAKLRSTFVCTVRNTGGENWHLESLQFNDGGG